MAVDVAHDAGQVALRVAERGHPAPLRNVDRDGGPGAAVLLDGVHRRVEVGDGDGAAVGVGRAVAAGGLAAGECALRGTTVAARRDLEVPRRPPGLEAPAEHRLVEGDGSRGVVVVVDGEVNDRVTHDILQMLVGI